MLSLPLTLIIMNMIFFCKTILSTLISLEYFIVTIFMLIFMSLYKENYQEMLIFMVMIVSESILGLVLLLMKVMYSGKDYFENLNVV